MSFCPVCGKAGLLECSLCRIYYCEEHQTDDWLRHRLECNAYKVDFSPKHGYSLKAARDISEGEIILTENPFIIGPAHFSESPCCVACSRGLPYDVDTLPRCPQCQWVICSQTCLGLSDPAGHVVECSMLQFVADKSCPQQFLLPFRCMLLQNKDPEMWNWFLVHSSFAVAQQADKSKHFPVASVLEGKTHTIFQQNWFPLMEYSCKTFQKIFAIFDAYGLDFRSPRLNTDLIGLYRKAGFLQLTCVPNTRTTFDDFPEAVPNEGFGRVVVTALRSIQKGEKLSCPYAMSLSSTYIRQVMFARKNLICRCPRCMDPRELGLDTGTMKCFPCGGRLLPVDTSCIFTCAWACDNRCGVVQPLSEVSKRFNHLYSVCQNLERPGVIANTNPENVEGILARFLTKFHTKHELCFSLKRLILQAYCSYNVRAQTLTNEQMERQAELCREVLIAMNRFGSYIHRSEMIVVSTIKSCIEIYLHLTQKKFPFANWTSDQVYKSVVNWLMLLERAFKVLQTTPADTVTISNIRETCHNILLWAETMGVNVPQNVNQVMFL